MQRPSPIRKILSSRFLLAVVGFAAVNCLVAKAMSSTTTELTRETISQQNELTPLFGSWTWWMAKGFLDQDTPPDVVLMGSSQMNAAARATDAKFINRPLDCVLHREVYSLEDRLNKSGLKHMTVANCALDGAMASDYWMTGKALLHGKLKPKVVVLGISPRDFIDNKLVSASATEPFHFFSRYVDSGRLASLAYPDPVARAGAQLEQACNALPTRSLHGPIDTILGSNPLRPEKPQTQEVLGVVRDAQMMVKPGEFMEPAMNEGFWVDNSREYVNRYKNSSPPCYPVQVSFFKEFLDSMRAQDTKVLVIGMPTLPQNRNLLSSDFWHKYREEIASICKANDAAWLDIADDPQFDHDSFVDTVHVNSKGGAKLFAVMTEKLNSESKLVNALKAPKDANLAYTSKTKLPQ